MESMNSISRISLPSLAHGICRQASHRSAGAGAGAGAGLLVSLLGVSDVIQSGFKFPDAEQIRRLAAARQPPRYDFVLGMGTRRGRAR